MAFEPAGSHQFTNTYTELKPWIEARLTMPLRGTMKSFIEPKLRQGRFSTLDKYIRSLVHDG
jgi:hypothetical protein